MQLFSKRYRPDLSGSARNSLTGMQLIPEHLRVRLQNEIKYFASSKNYLEPFLLMDDRSTGEFYLNYQTLKDMSLRLLGYNVAGIIWCNSMDLNLDNYNDLHFFDLIELLIVFSRDAVREELIGRIGKIFEDEDGSFVIDGFMIMERNASLKSMVYLIKDEDLRKKIIDYYESLSGVENDYVSAAKISADLVQAIFSSPYDQDGTKKYSEDLCRKVAERWTSPENVDNLSRLISEIVVNAKALSNQIKDVRHFDQHKISVNGPDIYKFITGSNILITELTISSLQDEFLHLEDPDKLKNDYLKKYSVDKNLILVRGATQPIETNIDDIPF